MRAATVATMTYQLLLKAAGISDYSIWLDRETMRWILAGLRHRLFTSLGELNAAIREQLERVLTSPGSGCDRRGFGARGRRGVGDGDEGGRDEKRFHRGAFARKEPVGYTTFMSLPVFPGAVTARCN